MAGRIQSDDYREVDPNFSIPEGLRTFEYKELGDELDTLDTGDGSDTYAEVDEVLYEADDDSDASGDTDDETPPVPEIYGIISQEITTAPDGSQVVNVVLEVEDIDAMSKYDIRFTG